MTRKYIKHPIIKCYKHKYKVNLYTKWFEVPTSLSCESLFSTIYLGADNENELIEIINKKFNGRKEIEKIEKIS